jgi:hypothetical protein
VEQQAIPLDATGVLGLSEELVSAVSEPTGVRHRLVPFVAVSGRSEMPSGLASMVPVFRRAV